jgi:hypothetical protein
VYEGIVPDRAASILNPKPDAADLAKAGGSTRPVRLRLRIPMRLRVGERPAGADALPLEIDVSSLAGERAESIGRRGVVAGVLDLREEEKLLGEGVARVRKKFDIAGLHMDVDEAEPSGHLERLLGERKMTGSIFSEASLLVLSDS